MRTISSKVHKEGGQLFKDNWENVGKDVVKGVMELFRTKKMLTGMNDTTITLIPKGSHAKSVGDYRPLSCCNTLYKDNFKNVM